MNYWNWHWVFGFFLFLALFPICSARNCNCTDNENATEIVSRDDVNGTYTTDNVTTSGNYSRTTVERNNRTENVNSSNWTNNSSDENNNYTRENNETNWGNYSRGNENDACIKTDMAPPSKGFSSQGRTTSYRKSKTLYISGQLGLELNETKWKLVETVDGVAQTTKALENVLEIVKAAGGCKQHIVKTVNYVAYHQNRIMGRRWSNYYNEIEHAYKMFFRDQPLPAATMVKVSELPMTIPLDEYESDSVEEANIMIEAVAVIPLL